MSADEPKGPALKPVTPARVAQEITKLSADRRNGQVEAHVYDQRFARMIQELRERRIEGTRADIQAALEPSLHLAVHTSEVFSDAGKPLKRNADGQWLLPIKGDGFQATLAIELSFVPETGDKGRV